MFPFLETTAERAAEKEAFVKEQYNRALAEEVWGEEDLARQLIIEDLQNTLIHCESLLEADSQE